MQRFSPPLAMALAWGLALSAPAFGETPQMIWYDVRSGNGSVLAYGVPKSDNTVIRFVCIRGREEVVVEPLIGSQGLRKDSNARTVLSSHRGAKLFYGKTVVSEKTGVINVKARGRMSDVLAILKSGSKNLTIETKGATRKVPLAGIIPEVDEFAAACKAP